MESFSSPKKLKIKNPISITSNNFNKIKISKKIISSKTNKNHNIVHRNVLTEGNFDSSIFELTKQNKNLLLDSMQKYYKNNYSKKQKDYSENIENLMSKYNYSNSRITSERDIDFSEYSKEMTKTKYNFFQQKREDIHNLFLKSRNFINKEFFSPDFRPTIKLRKTEYSCPVDSLGQLLKNKTIHDKILTTYRNRELRQFGERVGEYKHKFAKLIKLNTHVKITTILPKDLTNNYFEELIIKNNEQKNNNLNNNNNNNKSKSYEKKKSIIINNLNDINTNNLNSPRKQNNQQIIQNTTSNNSISLLASDFAKGSVYFLCNFFNSSKGFPESREQFCMNYDINTNNIYLFSGNCCNININLLWSFNLNEMKWKSINPNSHYIPEARSGHTGIIYKSKYFIFGGRTLINNIMGDLEIYNIENNTWTQLEKFSYKFVTMRKNHIACLVGQSMFIHGGIDENGEILNDSNLLSLNIPYSWTPALIASFCLPPQLAYHSCCLVAPTEILFNSKFSIYKFPEIGISQKSAKIKEKGIYLFGGKNKDMKEASNKLWLLKIGKNILEWVEVEAKGKPPKGRYLCSMNFFEDGNFIIIHGGRTNLFKNNKYVLKDTYLFELYRQEWIRVDYGVKESKVKNRYSHQGIINHNKLFIFGGIDENRYKGSDFFIINLDPVVAQQSLFSEKRGTEFFYSDLFKNVKRNNEPLNTEVDKKIQIFKLLPNLSKGKKRMSKYE